MTQVTVVQAPAPPTPPSLPGTPGGVTIVTSRALGAGPVTSQDVAALQARRSVLSDQLNSAAGRRRELARQLKTATGADKAGLEQRLGVLDARIARLEQEIDENGRLLSSAPVALIAQRQGSGFSIGPNAPSGLERNAAPLLAVFMIFVLCPIAVGIARALWKRSSLPRAAGTALPPETAQRLERMEQAMEAIAIEIERVSEGQRFVTKLLAEKGGAMEPLRVSGGERERV